MIDADRIQRILRPVLRGFDETQRDSIERALEAIVVELSTAAKPDAEPRVRIDSIIQANRNSYLRMKPPPTGQSLQLPAPRKCQSGDWVEVSIEAPEGTLRVIALPHDEGPRGPRITSTVNGLEVATYAVSGFVRFVTNGDDRWSSSTEFPAESAAAQAIASTSEPVAETWEEVLRNGNVSGSYKPTISAGQSLRFAQTGGSPAAGDIDADGDLTLDSVTDMHLHPHGALHLGHLAITTLAHLEASTQIDINSGGDLSSTAASFISDQAGTNWTATANSGDAQIQAGGLIRLVTGGSARIAIGAAGGWTINATEGTAGQYVRGFGAGATPQWATIAISDIPGLVSSGAVTGAVTIAAGGGASTFSGIRDNGSLETARSFVNFVSVALDTTFSVTQDAGNDELEVRVSTLGSFYSENDVGSIQTKFISFDDSADLTAVLTDNTGGSGYVNVTFTLKSDSVENAVLANMPANTYKANPTTSSADPQDVAVATNEVVCRAGGNLGVVAVSSNGVLGRSSGDLTDINCSAGQVLANLDEGNTSTSFGGQSRTDFKRWLNSQTRVSVFFEEFQGNLAGVTARFTSPAGIVAALSGTNDPEFFGALNLPLTTGNVRGRYTLGADENALNFNWGAVRYFGAVVRVGSAGINAETVFATGLVGPFVSYAAVTASNLASTSEGVFWEYRTDANSGQWVAGVRTGGTTSSTASGVAAATNTRYLLELFRHADDTIQWYLNGTLVRTDASGLWPADAACNFFWTMLGDDVTSRANQLDTLCIVSVAPAERFS